MNSFFKKNRMNNKELLFIFILSANIIEETIRALFYLFNVNIGIISLIDIGIYFICGLILFIKHGITINNSIFVTKREIKTFGMLVFLWVIFLLSTVVNDNTNQLFLSQFINISLIGCLFFYVGQFDYDYSSLLYYLRFNIVLSIIYSSLHLLIIRQNGYYMTLSYNILPWTIIAFIIYKNKKKYIYLIISIILAIMLLIFGARMPFLCFILFIVLNEFFELSHDKVNTKKIVIYIIIAILCIGIVLFSDLIVSMLSNLFPQSRTISYMALGNLFKSGDRSRISNELIVLMRDNTFKFNGFFSDRLALGNRFFNSNSLGFWITAENKYSVYAHNLFLEVLFDFGFFLGSIVCIWIVFIIVRGLISAWKNNNRYYSQFIIYVLVIGFVSLMVSNSFLQSYYFWLFLGVYVKSGERLKLLKNKVRRLAKYE